MKETQMNEEKILEALDLIREALEDDEEDYYDEEDVFEPETEDVTDECEVTIGRKDGGLRMYLTHNGAVIMRAGSDKVPGLTSYATSAGYSIEPTAGGLRGSYFRVLLTQ
jgi:hypothetical protein